MPTVRPIRHLALAALLALAACVTPPPAMRAGPDPRTIARVTDSAAAQVKRCYRAPRLTRAARQITTRLRVRYTVDGQLADYPVLVSQSGITPSNRAHAPAMAEAAMIAVVRCAPLTLPPEFYHAGWDEFDLTFSPPTFA
jgi:hypothetical protein